VEEIRPQLAGEDVASRHLAVRELPELRAVSPQLRAEGVLPPLDKERGRPDGVGGRPEYSLDSFRVSRTRDRLVELRSVDSPYGSLGSFDLSPGYVVIVGEGKDWQLCHWSWRA